MNVGPGKPSGVYPMIETASHISTVRYILDDILAAMPTEEVEMMLLQPDDLVSAKAKLLLAELLRVRSGGDPVDYWEEGRDPLD